MPKIMLTTLVYLIVNVIVLVMFFQSYCFINVTNLGDIDREMC